MAVLGSSARKCLDRVRRLVATKLRGIQVDARSAVHYIRKDPLADIQVQVAAPRERTFIHLMLAGG